MIDPDPGRLGDILDAFRDQPVLVVGDLILDQFVWGRVERISPEAPVPVVEVQRETFHLGGAANVAANLRVMEARPLLLGAIGEDLHGEQFFRELDRHGIPREGVVVDPERITTLKTRIIAQNQQVCRADRETRKPLGPDIERQILDRTRTALDATRATVLSDYSKGVLAGPLTSEIISAHRRAGRFVAVDPKVERFAAYRHAGVITPNKKEAEQAAGTRIVDEESLLKTGKKLLEETASDFLLITRGEEGMTLFDRRRHLHIPTVAREVFDVTGAGDTVIATLALAVAAGATVPEAALLANHAAGIVVAKLGTAAATRDEIRQSLNSS